VIARTARSYIPKTSDPRGWSRAARGFLVHYVTESRAAGPFYEGMHTIGYTGVDLFFVGHPAFTVVFIVYLALSVARPDLSKIPSDD